MKSLIIALVSTLVVGTTFTNISSDSKTILQGKVTDLSSGEPILFGTVSLMKAGVVVKGVETDLDGNYYFKNINPGTYEVEASYVGYTSTRIKNVLVKANKSNKLDLQISEGVLTEEIVIAEYKTPLISLDNTSSGSTIASDEIRALPSDNSNGYVSNIYNRKEKNKSEVRIRETRDKNSNRFVDGVKISPPRTVAPPQMEYSEQSDYEIYSNESYSKIVENKFVNPTEEALSTFSIDVDRAGYSNVRRYLDNGQMPPKDVIRIEEMINYFDYDYDGPSSEVPFEIHKSLVECPWNKNHQIMHVALQGKEIQKDQLPMSNLVFLIDVSGSMKSVNKLPLVKTSLKMLLQEMRPEDKVSIVVYAGAAGLALEPTSASQSKKILNAIDNLRAGGSTAGGAGIELAYKTARNNFIEGGNNRVILATDGDFNVGIRSDVELENLIEKERNSGVYLSVLGYGMGNYQDGKMQILADKGNGNHAYIDNIQEARKILVSEFAGTLFAIAKDVKIQVEFNPAHVQAYRLIGYENRMLRKEDFNNDKIDAGELGAGHTVTALYEIIPAGVKSNFVGIVDDLKYQKTKKVEFDHEAELATIKLRYKEPQSDKSSKIIKTIGTDAMSVYDAPNHLKFAMSVAYFGQALRKSNYLENYNLSEIIQLAENSIEHDPEGYKRECIRLMKSAQLMDKELFASR